MINIDQQRFEEGLVAREGHNSNPADKLKSFVDRIETLAAEKDILAEDIRGLYLEAKESELDVRALRALVRMRRQDPAKRKALEDRIDEYLLAMGMI